jgi:hypothetical protein
MTATQTREPARSPRLAQSAGSRHHPIRAVIGSWVILAAIVGAVAYATRTDPAAILLALGLVPLLTTPHVMPRRCPR